MFSEGLRQTEKQIQEYAMEAAVDIAESGLCGCMLLDSEGTVLFDRRNDSSCSACKRFEQKCDTACTCGKTHLYGIRWSERYEGKYIYFCEMGMMHVASPIIRNGEMCLALVGGPLLVEDTAGYIMEEVFKRLGSEGDIKAFEERIRSMTAISTERVRRISNVLSMVCGYISGAEYTRYYGDIENQRQQAFIGDYIKKLKTGGSDSGYPVDKEKELVASLSAGDKPNAQRLLNEMLGYIYFSSGYNFDVIRARITELIVLLSRAVMDKGTDIYHILGLNYHYFNRIADMNTMEELSQCLSKVLNSFTDYVFNFNDVKHVDVIFKAIEYIRKRYGGKVTLEETAQHVYLSPTYFSKIFKDDMKQNFSEYLTNLRIGESKKQLLYTDKTLLDIALSVGFEDQSYFSKIFKKKTGITPKKFREHRGSP